MLINNLKFKKKPNQQQVAEHYVNWGTKKITLPCRSYINHEEVLHQSGLFPHRVARQLSPSTFIRLWMPCLTIHLHAKANSCPS